MSAGLFVSQVAAAQDTADTAPVPGEGTVRMELNRTTDNDAGGCGLVVLTTNRTDKAIKRAAWQVAIFDQEGVLKALPVLDFGALMVGKNKIGVFQVPDGGCDTISRIIINDVAECTADDNSDMRDACLQSLETQTRTDIEFGL
ncbi:MAG: hypothetical protein DI616_01905 [Paracoccus denitrificans]|uniref:Tat pathway signal protein n=1 Tax=Paracoccus denitrificans TaxID=266 RepID=A0A533IF50_PARDE|nr:MAG: hypothetical protein DI616_01905 [Paracoccus denitrificans]